MTDECLQKFTPDQENYLTWLALPSSQRVPKTKTEYAENLGISRMGLWKWEQTPGFDEERRQRIKRWQRESTPEIIEKLKDKALTGDVSAIRVWMDWVEGTDNKLTIQHTGHVTFEQLREMLKSDEQPTGDNKNTSTNNIPIPDSSDKQQGKRTNSEQEQTSRD